LEVLSEFIRVHPQLSAIENKPKKSTAKDAKGAKMAAAPPSRFAAV
jgi:hypothetical protein